MSFEKEIFTLICRINYKKVLYTKVDKIYHINDIKKAVSKSNKFKRNGKIIVGFDKNLIKEYSDLLK